MPASVKWLEAEKILLYQISEPFTWKELSDSVNHAIQMVEAVPHQQIGTILNVSGIFRIPTGSLERGHKILTRKPKNAGPVVLLNAHLVVRAFVGIVRLLYPAISDLIYFADDLESAQRLLQQVLQPSASAQPRPE
jgi:hypothetical protein